MTRILAGIPKYKEGIDERGTSNSERLLTFVLLLRYTGMRIGDVTRLRSDQIDGQRLFLYTQKNRRSGEYNPAGARRSRTKPDTKG